jgi:2-isopropylmalate synthase
VNDYVRIFDTTLRDGEQSPGATMTSAEKLQVARALAKLGVDVIEAGFPAASPDDHEAVQRIALEVGTGPSAPIICALARTTTADIDRAWSAISPATRPRIHTFLATSPIHRRAKLGMSCDQIVERIREMVAYARALCEDVEFSPEDAGRTEPEFLHRAVEAAIAAGARTINVPDTVGYTQPAEFGALIAGIRERVPGAKDVVISVHCHDDLGLAAANTLAGLLAGARQAEVTLNGVGERAGNTALEEVVMALETRRDVYGLRHGIDTREIWSTSRLVSEVTGLEVQPNKAVVGKNAFAHEAGIHQDGMLKSQETYEIMRPETVGAPRTELVMGKHSGRRALQARLHELGFKLDGAALDQAFVRFKALADRRKYVADADLIALVRDEAEQAQELYLLRQLQVSCGTDGVASATVTLVDPEHRMLTLSAVGTGPVDAVFNAIDRILQTGCTLVQYQLRATNEGKDALGEAIVRVKGQDGRTFRGFGTDQDVIVASARAYLAAQNRSFEVSISKKATGSEP